MGLEGKKLNTYLQAFWRETLCCSGQIVINRTVLRGPERFRVGIFNVDGKILNIKGEIVTRQANGSYASYEDIPLPQVYFWLFLFELGAVGCYCGLLLLRWRRQRTALHSVFVVALSVKCFNCLLQSHERALYAAGGLSAGSLVYWLPQLSENLTDIVDLVTYLLTALGWKTMRPRLYVGEVRFIAAIAIATFYFGIFEISCVGQSCGGYVLSRLILRSLAYLCIIVAFNLNLAMLRSQILEATVGRDAGRLYSKKRAYSHFRWIFLLFLIQPSATLFIKVSLLSWEEGWVFQLLEELAKWGILTATVVVYSPRRSHMALFEAAALEAAAPDSATPAAAADS